MNVGDMVLYRLTALERLFLNKRLPEGEARWELGDVADARVSAIYDDGTLDLEVEEFKDMPWSDLKHPLRAILRKEQGDNVGQWSVA